MEMILQTEEGRDGGGHDFTPFIPMSVNGLADNKDRERKVENSQRLYMFKTIFVIPGDDLRVGKSG